MSIKDLRSRRGLTQTALSERVGLSQTRISEYELGKRDVGDMRVRTALRMMEALGTSDIRQLFDDVPKGNNVA
ncbi:helix-turn-helix domain-containing protein [Bifidobacterium moraviense]|uniref:helix-turn-helix domain-containing protein n=1 Tax=Bifidobacterium moraviense TaxID=2675323 RepID=UPI00145DAFA0|nr:helix-turn-helix transcriptional regulator [Bifidobacterium sp. DSM 109958]